MLKKIKQSLTLQMLLITLIGCGIFAIACFLRYAKHQDPDKYRNIQTSSDKTSRLSPG